MLWIWIILVYMCESNIHLPPFLKYRFYRHFTWNVLTGALVLHRSPKPQVHIMQKIKQRIKCLHSTEIEAGYCIPQEFFCSRKVLWKVLVTCLKIGTLNPNIYILFSKKSYYRLYIKVNSMCATKNCSCFYCYRFSVRCHHQKEMGIKWEAFFVSAVIAMNAQSQCQTHEIGNRNQTLQKHSCKFNLSTF